MVKALKNIYKRIGKDMILAVPQGMTGTVVDRYIWGPHKYIVVKFSNEFQMTFGDATHPLVSHKGYITMENDA